MKMILALVLLMVAPTLSPTSAASAASTPSQFPAPASPQERNKAVAGRVFEEIFKQGRFQVADEIYAKDFVNHGLHRNIGLQEDQAAVRWEKMALPDITITADLIMAEGDLVTVVWTLRGTNTARAGWVPATGVKVEERGITVWRIVDGKIRDEWTAFDELRIARQVATQLKWPLIGLLCAVMVFVWLVGRFIRKSLIHSSRAAKTN